MSMYRKDVIDAYWRGENPDEEYSKAMDRSIIESMNGNEKGFREAILEADKRLFTICVDNAFKKV